MTDNHKHMSCAEFSACMADLVAAGEDIFSHPHVRSCKLHRALLGDLEVIARAARELFPEIDPPDTLWEGIQARLDQEPPGPFLSEPWPGYRVVVAIKVMEQNNASPPAPGHSFAKSPVRLKVQGATRKPAQREGRG
jgi:hypothetical protein